MANPYINQAAAQETPEATQIMRRQQLAQQLLNQGQETPQGQMVSGHYVAPSWTQYLAQGLKSYMGGKQMSEAEQAQKAYGEEQKAKTSEQMKQMSQLLAGRPAITLPEDQQGPVLPAQAPDLNKAYQYAAGSDNPALQQFGMSGQLQNAQELGKLEQAKQQRLAQNQLWEASGKDPAKFMQLGGTPEMAKTFAEAPNLGKTKGVPINGQLVDPMTGTPIGTAIPKQEGKPSNVLEYEYAKGQGYKGTLEQFMTSQRKAGASSTNVSVKLPAGQTEYEKKVGDLLGAENVNVIKAAADAPEQLRIAAAIKNTLKSGAITGTGADWRLGLQKGLETAGIVQPGNAAATEELMGNLANVTLTSVKTSGLGAGQGFTDQDRKFLESAKSGTISNTPQNLQRVADLLERSARATHAKGGKVLQRWQQSPTMAGYAQDYDIGQLPAEPVTPKVPTSANSVTTPDGKTHVFPNAQAAQNFKKAAGLQ